MTRLQQILLISFLLVAGGWAFEGIRSAGFVHQDNRWQAAYPVQSRPVSPLQWTSPRQLNRSLMAWSWWAQERYTPSPLAFHALNLSLHVLVSLLVGLLVYRVGSSELGGWFAGGLFFLHPMQAESVAYVSGRTELLAAVGILLTCHLLIGRVSWWKVLLSGVTITLAFAGKEVSIALLVLVPALRKQWGLSVFLLGVLAVGTWGAASSMSLTPPERLAPMWVSTQASAGGRMLWTAMTGLYQTVDYDYDMMRPLSFIGYLIVLYAVTVLGGIFLHWAQPLISIGALCILAVVVPRLCVYTPLSYFNEHQFYSAMVGFTLIATGMFEILSTLIAAYVGTERRLPVETSCV